MSDVTLGRTGIITNKNGFGALPIQRISTAEAGKLLHKAYENGITYFDTARAYSDSEEKLGKALSDVRQHIFIATKSGAKDGKTMKKELETSLRTPITSMFISCTIHPFAQGRAERTGFTMHCSKPGKKEKSVLSALQTIASASRRRLWIPACMTRCSSRSITFPHRWNLTW